MNEHGLSAKKRRSWRVVDYLRSMVLAILVAGTYPCSAPLPKWLGELESQVGTATYEDVVARWGAPMQESKRDNEIIGVWPMEEVVRPNWSIHTDLRTVVCERYVKKAKMWFDDQQRLARIEYLPDGEGQRLGQANVPLISNVPAAKSPFYNFNNDDIRRMCMLDLACSRIALERCKMLTGAQKEKRE